MTAKPSAVLIPGLTRGQQARVLVALTAVTGLGDQVLMAAFVDADRGRVSILDPMPAIRRESYRAQSYGARRGAPIPTPTGRSVALDIAAGHKLPVDVAGIILGAACGLRLGLAVKSRQRTTTRPKLAVKVAKFAKPDTDLDVAKRWAREMGRVARGGGNG